MHLVCLLHSDADDLHRGKRAVIAVASHFVDGHHHIHSLRDAAKDRVLGRSRLVKEVQEAVVHSVDEELRTTGVWRASVGLEKKKKKKGLHQ